MASLLEWPARYHVVPTQEVAVVRCVQAKGQDRELVSLRWGLVPRWVKHPEEVSPQLANARAETVASKASFQRPFREQRCLILADGFFEWKRIGARKVPYCIRPSSQELITFAGIWESWENKQDTIESCSIITTAANSDFRPLHDRMPVILPKTHHEAWLDPAETRIDRLLSYLHEPAPRLEIYPVRSLRGKKSEDPRLIEPVERPAIQRTLFEE
ncbi:MAG TPA: SOS response-associated peptidase [Gemmatales bacterium]|nr:SOS response-associated peptidase [Gemmatales bacterium]